MHLLNWIVTVALALFIVAGLLVLVWKPWIPRLELVGAGSTGRRISQEGLIGNYFPANSKEECPAILLIGGSNGGLTAYYGEMAKSLQAAGYSVLQISYFRAPGQPRNLVLIPLETFFKGLDWLAVQPNVDADRLAIIGHSKGAEAALLVASRRADIKAVVVAAPSSVVWTGVDWSRGGGSSRSSWSVASEAIPFLPTGRYNWKEGFSSLYNNGLDAISENPDAVIPVESIDSPLLLVCGKQDTAWPSCRMARQIVARAADYGGPPTQLLSYEDAGHMGFGVPPVVGPSQLKPIRGFGGTPEGNKRAREASWRRVGEFLRAQLAQ